MKAIGALWLGFRDQNIDFLVGCHSRALFASQPLTQFVVYFLHKKWSTSPRWETTKVEGTERKQEAENSENKTETEEVGTSSEEVKRAQRKAQA